MNNTLNFKMSLDNSDFSQKANDAKNAINGMGESVKKNNTYMRDYMREIKNLKSQLLQLEEGTEEYTKAMQELADKTFALRDINETARLSANDLGERFALMSKTMGGVVETFGMVQGAMSLFGVEAENIDKALLKLTSVIAIVNGVGGFEELINKNLPACINMFKNLTAESKICAMAMKSIPYVAVASAIVAIIGHIAKQTKATKELTEEQKKAEQEAKTLIAIERTKQQVEETTTKTVAEMMGKYKLLQTQWNMLGNDIKAKEQFIKDNAKAFNDLGIQVDTVAMAEKILVNDTDRFCNAMRLRAQAIAIQNQIVKETEEYFNKIDKTGVKYGTHYYTAKEGDYFTNEEEAKAAGKNYKSLKFDEYTNGQSMQVNIMTAEDAIKVNAYRNKKAGETRKEYLDGLDKEFNARMELLNGRLASTVNQLEQNPYGGNTIVSNIPVYNGNGGGGSSNNNNNNNNKNDDNTPQQINLLDVLKNSILVDGNFNAYNEEYGKQTGNELNSKNYWDDLTRNLQSLADASGNSDFVKKIETLITTLPNYEAPKKEEEKVEVNVLQLAKDAIESGDFTALDEYIEKQTQAQNGSIKFLQQKINTIQEVADNSASMDLIVDVDGEVDKLKAQLEALKKQINKITGNEEPKTNENDATKKALQDANDIKSATSAIGQAFSSIAGFTDDATASWLTFFGQVLGTIPQLITAFTSLAATEAAAGQAAQGPFGWLGIPVAIGTTLSVILSSIPKFADGGIVGGNSFYGDKIICGLNSSEMVLNGVQQRNLFNLINNGGNVNNNGGTVKFRIQGTELVGVLNNYNNKMKKVL